MQEGDRMCEGKDSDIVGDWRSQVSVNERDDAMSEWNSVTKWVSEEMYTYVHMGFFKFSIAHPTVTTIYMWLFQGHNKPITALATDKNNIIYTGASDGQICILWYSRQSWYWLILFTGENCDPLRSLTDVCLLMTMQDML